MGNIMHGGQTLVLLRVPGVRAKASPELIQYICFNNQTNPLICHRICNYFCLDNFTDPFLCYKYFTFVNKQGKIQVFGVSPFWFDLKKKL